MSRLHDIRTGTTKMHSCKVKTNSDGKIVEVSNQKKKKHDWSGGT